MPLSHLATALPGLRHTEIDLVVHKRGWLLAQSCKSWFEGPQGSDDISELLLVYRSPHVKDTDKVYAPVRDRIIRAEKLEELFEDQIEDEGMMGQFGRVKLYRFTQPGLKHIFTVQQVQDAMKSLWSDHEGGLVI